MDETVVAEFFGKTNAQQHSSRSSESAYILFYEARRTPLPEPEPSGGKGKEKKEKKERRKEKEKEKKEKKARKGKYKGSKSGDSR